MKTMQPRVVVAVDPHKQINAVNVVDDRAVVLAREVFPNTADGYRQLLRLGRRWRQRCWAVEGCGGVGRHLAQRLVAQHETVLDVPTRRSSLVRAFATTSGRKTDDIDAYSVALAALNTPGLHQVTVEGRNATLRLLASRRQELVALRTQAVCRLHRELLVMLPGGAPRRMTATSAKALLAGVRPRDEVTRVRKQLALDQLTDLVRIDGRLKDINRQLRDTVKATGSGLTELYGVGPVITAIVLGEVNDIARFKNRHHFASYNGSAPIERGSGGEARACVNLSGNRQLNHALHMAAMAQLRQPESTGGSYYQRKRAEGKSVKEAIRCLKRRISDAIYRQLVLDAAADEADPGGQTGTTISTGVTTPTPTGDSSVKPHTGSAASTLRLTTPPLQRP
jgi:transposase